MLKSIVKPQLFCYSHTPQAIATTVTSTPAINISNDSDFELVEIRASIIKAAAFDGTLLMQVSLSSGELFSNVGVDLLSFGSAQQDSFSGYPIRFPEGIRIPANSVLSVQLTNNNGATITVQVQLWGYKREVESQ